MGPFHPKLLECQEREAGAQISFRGDEEGVEGSLILEMGLSSVKCVAMFGNDHRDIHLLFQNILLVPLLRMHPDLWGARLQQL